MHLPNKITTDKKKRLGSFCNIFPTKGIKVWSHYSKPLAFTLFPFENFWSRFYPISNIDRRVSNYWNLAKRAFLQASTLFFFMYFSASIQWILCYFHDANRDHVFTCFKRVHVFELSTSASSIQPPRVRKRVTKVERDLVGSFSWNWF